MYAVNVKSLSQLLFFAAVSLTLSCALPESRISPPSSSPKPAAKNNQHRSETRASGSSSTAAAKNDRHPLDTGAADPSSSPIATKKPRYNVLENYHNKAFEDKVTGKIWTMFPVAYSISQSLARSLCQTSNIGGHHWVLPLAKDFITLANSKEDLTIAKDAPFRVNYDKFGPFWTKTKVANTAAYYMVVGFDQTRKYEGVDADVGRFTAVCIQK